jgi:uncharacterized protein involved in outer membrane biogenesis
MPALLRNRWVIAVVAFALFLGAALLAATRLVPNLVRSSATEWVQANLGLPISLGEIRFNPLALTLDVSDIRLPAGEVPMVRIRHLHADFAFTSLFAGDWRFDAIRIDEPMVDARIGNDGKLNLLKLVPPPNDDPLPALLIADLAVSKGQARFRDETLGPDATAHVIPLDFALQNLHTTKDAGGRFNLTAASDIGETIAWSGTASMAPIASKGGISLKNLSVTRAGAFLADALPTRFLSGSANVSLTYDLSYDKGVLRLAATSPALTIRSIGTDVRRDVLNANLSAGAAVYKDFSARYEAPDGQAPHWSVEVGGIGAADIVLTGKGPAAGESFRVKRLSFGGVAASSRKPGGTADSFTVEGLDITLTREPGGGVGILRLLPASVPGEAQEPAAPLAIDHIRVKDARITFLEKSTPRPGKYELAPLDLEIRGLDTASPKPLAISARGAVNGRPFSIEGNAATDGTSADAAITLDALPLALALPYLPDFPAIELISGTLAIDGTARYRLKARGEPDIGFNGRVTISDFRLKELVRNSDLFAFRTFLLSGIRYDGRSAIIERGRLMAPVGQVALLPNGQFNYGFLLDEGTSVEAARAVTGRKAAAPKLTRAERREARAKAEAEKAARAAARAAPTPATPEPDLPLTMKRLDIESGRLAFADLTIEPSFAANISNLRGSITNLSNRPRQLSTIALRGQVISRFAPVTIDGKANLFDYAADTDVHFVFKNIDLTVFNPYSGEYAGYAIASGRLTADLDYRIINSALEANHKVEIADLQWGSKAEGKRAPFPVRFATNVMKDKDGVIRLELPVSGTVDDPEFSLGPLIWKALGRFLGRIATAPFRAIGGLFGGDDEPEKLVFTPGSPALPEEAAKVLPEIGKFLSSKEGVTLVIPAGPGTEADAKAIANDRIDAAVMVKERKTDPKASSTSLAPAERHARLLRLYRIQFGRAPAFAEVQLPAEAKAPADPKAARLDAEIRQMTAELQGAWLASDNELASLGRARAAAVQTALLATPGLSPDRIRLSLSTAFADKGGKPMMELKMEEPEAVAAPEPAPAPA